MLFFVGITQFAKNYRARIGFNERWCCLGWDFGFIFKAWDIKDY